MTSSSNDIKRYDYSEFQGTSCIGTRGSSIVYQAYSKSLNTTVALKSQKNGNDEITNEIKLLRKIDHPNIIKFIGISKNDSKDLLILEYASGGTLRNYLRENVDKIDWNIKFELATQIADAVSYLNDQQNIIHGDLHSKNILVHQIDQSMTIKIAGFGTSVEMNQAEVPSDTRGIIPYTDPQRLIRVGQGVNKKSDVYSVGVLLWVISSGREPFSNGQEVQIVQIIKGLREDPITGTPTDYIKIYEKCWKCNPDDRPDMQEVVRELEDLKRKNKTNTLQLFSENEDITEDNKYINCYDVSDNINSDDEDPEIYI